jgi:hypothetical protein
MKIDQPRDDLGDHDREQHRAGGDPDDGHDDTQNGKHGRGASRGCGRSV